MPTEDINNKENHSFDNHNHKRSIERKNSAVSQISRLKNNEIDKKSI